MVEKQHYIYFSHWIFTYQLKKTQIVCDLFYVYSQLKNNVTTKKCKLDKEINGIGDHCLPAAATSEIKQK